MKHTSFNDSFRPRHDERGFYLIGLLMVLVIIAILVGGNPFGGGSTTSQMQQAKISIDRANNGVCAGNRSTVRTELIQWMALDGRLPSEEELNRRLYSKLCPDGGTYEIDAKQNIFCTDHEPAPEGLEIIVSLAR